MRRYSVTGMTCSACSAHVQKAVEALPFVSKCEVSLLTGQMRVETQNGEPRDDEVCAAVRHAGYGVVPEGRREASSKAHATDPAEGLRKRMWTSFAFLLPLMYVSMGGMIGLPLPAWLDHTRFPLVGALCQLLLTLPVIYVNRAFFRVGFKRLVQHAPNMDSLIAVGSGSAFLYGWVSLFRMAYGMGVSDMAMVHEASMSLYFESAAMILALVTMGKYLEARAKKQTTSAIEKLMQLAPETASVLENEQERVVMARELKQGDVLLIRPGERIPVDGVLLDEGATLDQAHITGESIPAEKKRGDTLLSGSLNQNQAIRMQASRVGEDTTLARISRMVAEAGDSKAPISKLADHVSGVFVPVVMGIAVLTLIVWLMIGRGFGFALNCAISVLVISCPCALGLATPVAIMAGTGVGAKHGVLFRNGEVLETLHHVTDLVLDKTGTLTQGVMSVQRAIANVDSTEEQLLTTAAGLESGSEHPVARAVLEYAKQLGIAAKPQAWRIRAIPGKGVAGEHDGVNYWAGSFTALKESDAVLPQALRQQADELAAQGMTVVCVLKEKQPLGVLGISDTLRPTSAQAIDHIKRMKIVPHLLTGDQQAAAQTMAARVGIEQVMAEVLPQDKALRVQSLQQQGRKVAMVGDGINDAPALKQADVGIAVGSGTDIAIETADVVLASGQLTDVATAISLSARVLRTIKENLFWAFFYNIIGIPIAAGVLYPVLGVALSPMLGAAAMSLSSVFVVTNALRLRYFKAPSEREQNKEERTMETIKTIRVEGMSCNHCKMSVEKALSGLSGVKSAVVDLQAKTAQVTLFAPVSDEQLKNVVIDAGFEVNGID